MPGNVEPRYSRVPHVHRGLGRPPRRHQPYLDATQAYRQRLPQRRRVPEEVRVLGRAGLPAARLGADRGPHQRCRRHPERLRSLYLPTAIFDFDVKPSASGGRVRADRGQCAVDVLTRHPASCRAGAGPDAVTRRPDRDPCARWVAPRRHGSAAVPTARAGACVLLAVLTLDLARRAGPSSPRSGSPWKLLLRRFATGLPGYWEPRRGIPSRVDRSLGFVRTGVMGPAGSGTEKAHERAATPCRAPRSDRSNRQ